MNTTMTQIQANSESANCRVVLMEPYSQAILVQETVDSYALPRISLPEFARPAQHLQEIALATWNVCAFVADFLFDDSGLGVCIVAEVHDSRPSSQLKAVRLDEIPSSQITEMERGQLTRMLSVDRAASPGNIGWIDEAVTWTELVTGRTFSEIRQVKQMNAGGSFALLTLLSDDSSRYWLKATGTPNLHELQVTVCLSRLCRESLPRLVAIHTEWNAWITEDGGRPAGLFQDKEHWASGLRAFAALQLNTIDHAEELLAAGVYDHRIASLRSHIEPIFAFLVEAMGRQTSVKAVRLDAVRLSNLAGLVREASFEMEALQIPDTLLHNDFNEGNMLFDGTKWSFIDWSEAAIGNPFLSLDRFPPLKTHDSDMFKAAYREMWAPYLTQSCIDRALILMPLLSIFAYLYGRGDWLKETTKVRPGIESYARSLARHMDRAARNSLLQEALCRS